MHLPAVTSGRSRAHNKCGNNRNFLCVLAVFLALLFLMMPAQARHEDKEHHRILVLQSYHPNRPWTQWSMEGIEAVMNQHKGEVRMDVEYMDTRRITDPEHYRKLFNLLKHKAKNRNYDVIISAHVNALKFLLEYADQLYPDVPIVFYGIQKSFLPKLEGKDIITGIIQSRTLEPAVETATRLHPKARQLVFVNYSRNKTKELGLKRRIAKIEQNYSGHLRTISWWLTEPTVEELLKVVDGLGDESIVFFTGLYKDKDGNRYIFKRASELIERRCKAPIYALASNWFGYGPVMGGKYNDGFIEGRMATQMALRILNGQRPQDIPIVREGVSSYVFDYVQLKRFNVQLSNLPPGSKIRNKPESFYHRYRGRIWGVITVTSLLVLTVVFLLVNVFRRHLAEKKLIHYQDQLKKLTSELSVTEERERRSIATRLHEQIGRPLAISRDKLRQIDKSGCDNRVARELGEVRHMLDQTIEDTTSLTFDLSPPMLYEMGFDDAVKKWLVEQINHKHGIATEFVGDGQAGFLDENIAVSLFRSVRELLFNVVKHANAGKVKVTSRKLKNRFYISVEDDGVGFDLSEAAFVDVEKGGFGLFSIRERLERIGGRIEIDTGPGKGTTVTIVSPISSKKTADKRA